MKPNASLHGRFVGALLAGLLAVGLVAEAATPGPGPDVSISLRGIQDGTIEVGEPFQVAVRVDAPVESTGGLQLAPASGTWIEATTVEMVAGDGRGNPIVARVVARGADRVTTVDADHAADGLWWFPAETLGPIVPGNYVVQARLTIHDGAGWQGEVVSEPVTLRVVAGSNDPARATQRILARATSAILEKAPAKAAGILDAELETAPDNVPVLNLRAALCLEGGNPMGARICIERALTLAARQGGEPSGSMHALADRIEAASNDGAVVPPVPAWAIPPRSLFNPLPPVAPANSVTPVSNPTIQAPLSSGTPASPAPVNASGGTKVASGSAVVVPLGAIVSTAELIDARIIADPAGQWAVTAIAGTQYGKTQYSAAQATGAPNILTAGNSPDAWCPENKNVGTDWLELTFAKPVHATEVRVRQNDAAGAITKIEAIEPDGTAHVWWEGIDPYVAPAVREIAWFAVRVPKTAYLVAKVKITLNLASGPGYKEIDAVQLVGAAP
jgi:hypothetical protein